MYVLSFDISFILYFLSFVFFLFVPVLRLKYVKTAAYGLLIAAAKFNFVAIILRWNQLGYPPVSNMHETLVLLSLLLTAACLAADGMRSVNISLGGCAAFFSLLSLGYASLLDIQIRPLMPALKSNWLVIHVVSYFIGYSACFVAFISGILHLSGSIGTKDKVILNKADILGYRSVMIAFPLLTAGITTGAVWANTAWGRYWGWDPKETWALITWLIYVLYLHVRRTSTEPARFSAVLAVTGFVCVIFTFIGVSMFFSGLHSYR
jgi:ABC-type transport system involved in cytochrome c biogenesis permease subunit